jgi:hypothetical protein
MKTICPEPALLRAWLDRGTRPDGPDGPAGPVSDGPAGPALRDADLADHLAACVACQTALDALDRDARHAARALDVLAVPAPSTEETELALARLRDQLADAAAASTAPAPARANHLADLTPATPRSAPNREQPTALEGLHKGRSRPPAASAQEERALQGEGSHARSAPLPVTLVWQRWRLALAGLAAALALAFALATPQGQAIAAGFLSQFRSQRLAIVTIDPTQARQTGLFRLEKLGAVRNNQPPRPIELASVQEAASRAGFPVLQPDPATLPAEAARTPKVRFSPASETRLTFDREKTRAYFDSINRKDLALPDRLHGSTLVVALPPVVMLEYARSDNKPAVMVGEAREVQVDVEGSASLAEVRSFLLGLPDLPPDLARQLQTLQDWTTTLPIPVPVDKVTWQRTTIGGAEAYILNDNTGLGSGVIWQRDGRILGVAGPMKADDLRKVAESLR